MEGRDLSSRRASEAARNGRLGNLVTPPSVQKLQKALHAKAKGAPGFQFYALYDKVYREDVLRHAYDCCKANGGAAGVDEERFEDIEAYGLDRWLGELAQELKEKTYRPQAARRVYIPKQSGSGLRSLSIPTIRDRTAQAAAKLALEPIFEADLPPEQHGYRPERNALSAVKQVHSLLNTGYTHVVDADLSAYFDTVPHSELLQSVACRVVDRQMLHLIKMWLETPVEETDERERKTRTTRNRDEKRGIPQGSPLSPLLSNIYIRRFVLGWKHLGYERRFGARIVSYADDLVICCKGNAEEAPAVPLDHGVGERDAHPVQIRPIDRVLKAQEGRLRGKIFAPDRVATTEHLMDRIASQSTGVVAIRIATGNGVQALAQQIPNRMADLARLAPVIGAVDQRFGHPGPSIAGLQQDRSAIGAGVLLVELLRDRAAA